MFAISPEGSYMWASDYRMGFVYTYLKNILLRENVMAAEDNAWDLPTKWDTYIKQLSTGRRPPNHPTICSLIT